MKFARVDNGIVVELGEFEAAPKMHPSLQWIALDPQPNGAQVAIGWTWANNAFAAPVPTLDQARAEKVAAIGAAYEARIAAGYTWNGKLFEIDNDSRANINGAGSMASALVASGAAAQWPADFGWVAADNTIVPMTAAQVIAFGLAVGFYYSGVVLRERILGNAVAAAADLAAVAAIDIATGWPEASGVST